MSGAVSLFVCCPFVFVIFPTLSLLLFPRKGIAPAEMRCDLKGLDVINAAFGFLLLNFTLHPIYAWVCRRQSGKRVFSPKGSRKRKHICTKTFVAPYRRCRWQHFCFNMASWLAKQSDNSASTLILLPLAENPTLLMSSPQSSTGC